MLMHKIIAKHVFIVSHHVIWVHSYWQEAEVSYNAQHVASSSRMETLGDSWSWNKYNVVSLTTDTKNCIFFLKGSKSKYQLIK
jgi:hypothetical protein